MESATDGSLLAESGDVDLVLRVRERGRLMLKTSTDVGNGEGTAVSHSSHGLYVNCAEASKSETNVSEADSFFRTE